MNSDQRIALIIGDLAIKNAVLTTQLDEALAKIAALEAEAKKGSEPEAS